MLDERAYCKLVLCNTNQKDRNDVTSIVLHCTGRAAAKAILRSCSDPIGSSNKYAPDKQSGLIKWIAHKQALDCIGQKGRLTYCYSTG